MNNRRQFIKMMMGFVSGMGLLFSPLAQGVRVAFAKAKKMILPKETQMNTLIGKNPADLDTSNLDVTPLEKFQTMGLTDHQANMDTWRLEVSGHVQRPLRLTYDQIVQMPAIQKNVLLICPGFFAYHARWKGVSVAKLLEMADVGPGITHVTFKGPDGTYAKTERFPIEEILSNKVFLAYNVNDRVLPKKHGFPLRFVANGHYGGEWVKYVYKVTADKI